MEISRYDHLVTYDGLPTLKKLDMLSMERGLPIELHEFINELKQQYTLELIHARCKPFFQHEYALSKLRQDYKLVVCSNSVRNTIEVMLDKASILKYFDFYLSNQDVENGKPDPEIYITAMQKLQKNPGECLIIEDNENGIIAARESGAHLLKVDSVEEVNLHNIKNRIKSIEDMHRA
jgi:HAD superfamily hydrolase (TIGR01509 family)